MYAISKYLTSHQFPRHCSSVRCAQSNKTSL